MLFCVFNQKGSYHGSLTTIDGKFNAEQLDRSLKTTLDWEHCSKLGIPYLRPMGFEDGLAMIAERIPLNDKVFAKAFVRFADSFGLETIPFEGKKIYIWQKLLSAFGAQEDIYRYARALRLWPEAELDAFNVLAL
ncbi:MAG: hypothetical protein WCK01_04300 [Candidatus Uhrbacteria bacterium]